MARRALSFGLEGWLRGADLRHAGRIAYVGNRASLTAAGDRTGLDLLRAEGATVAALWAPEHGFDAAQAPGAAVLDDFADAACPVYSLYGARDRPSRRMLQGCDTIVFDLQDVGVRYYTFWFALKRCLEAAAATGKNMVVCDRPDPLGPATWGNVLDDTADAQVGCWPIAMQHGLTVGDVTARWRCRYSRALVTIAWMDGWRRADTWDAVGRAWTPPSPNLPDLNAVAAYPGTCLGEGTTLSVGRGTPWPFQWLGAPWLDADRVAADLTAAVAGWGVAVETCTPDVAPYVGEQCRGVRLIRTNAGADPVSPVLTVLGAALRYHPEKFTFHAAHFDALAGGPALREGLLAGRSVADVTRSWRAAREAAAFTPTDTYD